jgi:hypothetical protein
MTSKNPKDQAKAPAGPARPARSAELENRELDTVVGGLKKNTGKTDDPCGGGE